jgi:hypothetical protein
MVKMLITRGVIDKKTDKLRIFRIHVSRPEYVNQAKMDADEVQLALTKLIGYMPDGNPEEWAMREAKKMLGMPVAA